MANVDRLFAEPRLAELDDAYCSPGQPDFPFYLPLVMEAQSVLDVGCGTGELLRLTRDAGHKGRLTGLDPALAMLNVARHRDDVEWVHGELATVAWQREFDLVVMTGHAFQVYVTDDELRVAFAAIHAALKRGGRFVFETRNLLVQDWETWNTGSSAGGFVEPETVTVNGETVSVVWAVTNFESNQLTFKGTYSSPSWQVSEESWSTLRFLTTEEISRFLVEGGLKIDAQFGNWDRSALTDASPEIITIASRALNETSPRQQLRARQGTRRQGRDRVRVQLMNAG